MSTSIELNTAGDVELTPSGDVVTCTQSVVPVIPEHPQEIRTKKREYTIVGDALFASMNSDAAPSWLLNILDNIIDSRFAVSLEQLSVANSNILDAIDEITVANNNYQEMINIDATVDAAISSRLSTLNSKVDENSASIITLDTNKVTADQATAIALTAVTSSLNDTSVGSIGGKVAELSSSISTLSENVTTNRTLIESRYGDLNEAIIDLTMQVETDLEGVSTMFAYNATIKIGDEYFKSGFGLNTAAKTPVPGEPGVYTSEFWVDAQRFYVGTPGSGTAPFEVVGGTTYIKSAAIKDASIDRAKLTTSLESAGTVTVNGVVKPALKINLGTTNAGIEINGGTSAGSLVMTNQNIVIRDGSTGQIRVRLGVW